MTDQPEALMQWARDAGSTPEDLVRFATLTIADRDAEIQELREANETFGKRQEWWNEKMFDMELEVERLRNALYYISLASQNSMSSQEECGRIARAALEVPR